MVEKLPHISFAKKNYLHFIDSIIEVYTVSKEKCKYAILLRFEIKLFDILFPKFLH